VKTYTGNLKTEDALGDRVSYFTRFHPHSDVDNIGRLFNFQTNVENLNNIETIVDTIFKQYYENLVKFGFSTMSSDSIYRSGQGFRNFQYLTDLGIVFCT